MIPLWKRVAVAMAVLCGAAFPLRGGPALELWEKLREDPVKYKEQWQQTFNELRQRVLQTILIKDATFRRLAAEEMAALKAMVEAEAAFRRDNREFAEIDRQYQEAVKQYGEYLGDESRLREVGVQQRQVRMLARKRRELLESSPELIAARALWKNAAAATEKQMDMLLQRSMTEDARELRELLHRMRQLAEKDAAEEEEAPAENPFAETFSDLSKAVSNRDFAPLREKMLEEKIRSEWPKADPAVLDCFVRGWIRGEAAAWDHAPESETPLEDPLAEFCRLVRREQDEKLRRTPEFGLEVRRSLLKIPRNTFLRACAIDYLRGIVSEGQMYRNQTNSMVREFLNQLRAGASGEYMHHVYNVISGCSSNDDFKRYEAELAGDRDQVDPWMWAMITGRAAIARAWDARGSGFANTVSRRGWEGFRRELGVARDAFYKALELHPEWGNPYVQLLSVEMGDGSVQDRIEVFNKLVKIYPDISSAYSNLSWGLLPRWGGSHQLILQLADAAMATERYDTDIPSLGFIQLGRVAWDYPDYRWKNIYRRRDMPARGDRLFAKRLEAVEKGSDGYDFLLVHRALFEMATLRYDQAAATIREYGGMEKFADFCRNRFWRGTGGGLWYPLVPQFSDLPTELRLFTGEQAEALRAAELAYLGGEGDAGRTQLKELIRQGNWTASDRAFLIDLYGRWSLNFGGSEYYDCNDGARLYNSFQVAGRNDASDVVRELIELGFDYAQYENYPGETAVNIARRGTDTNMIDVLKQAGDPLDRPEPKYGRTPLHVAAMAPNVIMVRKLMALGAPCDKPDGHGHVPLHLAAAAKGVETVQVLLEAGADPDVGDRDGDTALMFTMQVNGPKEIRQALIQRTRNVNQANHSGRTALHYAAQYIEDPEAIRELLAAGADASLRDRGGQTAADIARGRNRGDLAELLRP